MKLFYMVSGELFWFLYACLKNETYYVISLYGWAGVDKMVSPKYLENISRILTKLGTQKHQVKTKTKFKPGDVDLIF